LRTTRFIVAAASAVAIVGLGAGTAFASQPPTNANAPISASVSATIGFGIAPSGFNFGSVSLGSVAEQDQTITVVGNDNYGLTVQDGHTDATDPNADMGTGNAASMPANTLWLAMSAAPNGIANDSVLSVNDCQTSGGLTGATLPAEGSVTPASLQPAASCTEALPAIPVDGNSGSGTSEGAPVGGTDTFGLRWLLNVPSGQASGAYSATLVYSLTGA
jgi:hypothetical protein